MKEVKMGMGRRVVRFLEDGERVGIALQMTWFYVVSQRRT